MIPLSKPFICGNEWDYVKDCLDTSWVSSAGQYVVKFGKAISQYTGSRFAVAVQSGTAALHLGLRALGVREGDIVIMPDIAFISGANSVRYLRANPLFIDINPTSWQMDVDLLERFLKEECQLVDQVCQYKRDGRRVSALMTVHTLGYMGDMERIRELVRAHKLKWIEDAAAAIGSRYKDKHAGTWAPVGCISFNGNKVITTGGGGIVLTDSQEIYQNVLHLSQQAKAHKEEYIHDEMGYNYRMVNLSAAMGLAQLEQLPIILEKRKKIASWYKKQLGLYCHLKSFPQYETFMSPNFWMNTIRINRKKEFMQYFTQHKIQVRSIYYPLHKQSIYQNCQFVSKHQESVKLYESAVSLPSFPDLSEDELQQISKRIKEFFEH